MTMRPLIIDEAVRATIARILEYAVANPVDVVALALTVGGSRPPVGDNPANVCVIPMGYRCVFSIEEQPKGNFRHLSVSVAETGKAPNEQAVLEIMKLFGFKATAYGPNLMIWLEDLGKNWKAVNVLEPFSQVPVRIAPNP